MLRAERAGAGASRDFYGSGPPVERERDIAAVATTRDQHGSSAATSTPMRRIRSACRACAASGHAAAPLPKSDELAPPHGLPLRPSMISYFVVGIPRSASQENWPPMAATGAALRIRAKAAILVAKPS